ncbi:MAG TPA: hypothetical protein VGQ62_19920, partial [Chloroflexota bacterium]|nr:hypothetical protein [Chloroflexota bacterium]
CIFAALQSTLISIYPLALMAAYYVVRRWSAPGQLTDHGVLRSAWRTESMFVAILVAPHVAMLLVLLQQGTLSTFITDAFVFNQRYYAHYDIGGDPLTMLRNAAAEFAGLIVTYLRPGAWREVETVLLLSNLAAIFVVWRTRGRLFASFFVALVFLSRMRGPGYHGAPYFVLSFASLALVLAYAADVIWRLAISTLAQRTADDQVAARLGGGAGTMPTNPLTSLAAGAAPAVPAPTSAGNGVPRSTRSSVQPILQVAAAVVVIAYGAVFFHDIGGFVLHLRRGDGLQSPYSAAVAAASAPTDRIWVAPLDPSVYLDTGRLPASAYTYYHPWLAESPEITAAVLHDLQTVRPAVIVFEADKRIDWLFPLPIPAEYGAAVFAYIQQAYAPIDPQDPLLRNVYIRRD